MVLMAASSGATGKRDVYVTWLGFPVLTLEFGVISHPVYIQLHSPCGGAGASLLKLFSTPLISRAALQLQKPKHVAAVMATKTMSSRGHRRYSRLIELRLLHPSQVPIGMWDRHIVAFNG